MALEDEREQIKRWLDALYRTTPVVTQIDAVVRAETFDLPADMMDIVNVLPSGRYSRARLTDHLNSAITGRGLSRQLGTHD